MFGFSLATQIFQGSTQRTWNCVSRFANLLWGKFIHYKEAGMPRSRKRHHSRSRSRSRSHSTDRSYDKHKKNDSNEKDGKRRKLDDVESPQNKRSLSSENIITTVEEGPELIDDTQLQDEEKHDESEILAEPLEESSVDTENDIDEDNLSLQKSDTPTTELENDPETSGDTNTSMIDNKIETISTPKKPLTPKQVQKKLESEKKRQQRQKEKEERDKQKQEEKDRILAEKQKLKQQKEAERQKQLEEKQKQLELKQKDKELKEEQKRKEREEKEQKRKEKEEKEEQKRKEKELEKQKKQQEIEEKNKEKQKEEEKKQKTAALFANFFKKSDKENAEKEKKLEKTNSAFMPFEVKSDMRLAPIRRKSLSEELLQQLDSFMENQNEKASYLNELKSGSIKPCKTSKTWPYEEADNDVVIVEEDKNLGETICESTNNTRKLRAKFLYFHENRRPAYFGTWRKKSSSIGPRTPFNEDTKYFNYEEDSDDDWEEEEQGESLDVSGDEEDKEAENDQDDYEVDNDFFVPHGHLSEDEMDDEENAKLSPETLKQKLKLLKAEFDEDMKSKTHKLKPRSIGCIWVTDDGDNVDEAILRYLEPFAVLANGPIEIKSRQEIFSASPERKKSKAPQELPPEHIPLFLKVIHGSSNKKKVLVEEFLTYMANKGLNVEVSKANLIRFLKKSASYRRCTEKGPKKNKFGWFVNDDVKEKFDVNDVKEKFDVNLELGVNDEK